jgi:hypothetical protein
MHSSFFAPLAILLELNLALNFLFVFSAPVVYTFTTGASQFDKVILRHSVEIKSLIVPSADR